ncbi:MAG: spermidine synthase, partial [Gammaproteobacteria bacterium]
QYFFQFHVLLTLTLYLLAIIAPIIYFLGQTVPITVNLFKEENAKTIGAISGKVLHLSTLGSFLGAVLTTLFFMNYLGVAWTIIVNVGILLFLIILLTDDIKRELWKLLGIVGVFIIVTEFNLSTERINFLKTTPYGNYQVNSTDTGKVLMINDSSSSYISNTEQGFPYIEYIKQVLFDDLKLHNKKILVLGAGGFTLSAERHDENRFTYVDIDPDIKSIVEHHFLMSNKIKGEFYAEDARTYVKNTMEYYDVIVSDVYSNTMTIPAHLLTQEHLQAIQARLAPDGIAVFNIIARPLLTDAYSKRMDNTVRSVFQRCMATPLKYSPEITNIIYLCRNSKEKEEDDRQIYTDNKNSSTMDFFNLR